MTGKLQGAMIADAISVPGWPDTKCPSSNYLTSSMYALKPIICAMIGCLAVLSDVQTAKAFGWLLIIISLYIYWMRWRY